MQRVLNDETKIKQSLLLEELKACLKSCTPSAWIHWLIRWNIVVTYKENISLLMSVISLAAMFVKYHHLNSLRFASTDVATIILAQSLNSHCFFTLLQSCAELSHIDIITLHAPWLQCHLSTCWCDWLWKCENATLAHFPISQIIERGSLSSKNHLYQPMALWPPIDR